MKSCLWLCAILLCQSIFASNGVNPTPGGGEGVTPLSSGVRGWTESSKATNLSLLVGVDKGLPGIDLDVKNVERMGNHPDYNFKATNLYNKTGTTALVAKNLTEISSKVEEDGTFLFYFSGHGGKETLLMEDRTMKVQEIRAALEAGRKNIGPLKRLLLFFDSCYSGSLLPKFRGMPSIQMLPVTDMQKEADSIVEALKPTTRDAYFDKLFVFASSRADETSAAGSNGSAFTVALGKAFDEGMEKNDTIGEFIQKTYDYTKVHHPVARLVPEDLNNEKMRN